MFGEKKFRSKLLGHYLIIYNSWFMTGTWTLKFVVNRDLEPKRLRNAVVEYKFKILIFWKSDEFQRLRQWNYVNQKIQFFFIIFSQLIQLILSLFSFLSSNFNILRQCFSTFSSSRHTKKKEEHKNIEWSLACIYILDNENVPRHIGWETLF